MSGRSGLGRASIAMFAATVVLNLAMVLYHRVMSSKLGDGYAQLAALTGAVNVLNVFALGALATLTKVFSRDIEVSGDAAAAQRLRRVSRGGLLWAAGCGSLLLLATPWASDFLRLPTRRLFAMTALLFAGFIAMVIVRAALQGRRAYPWLAGSYVAEGAGRLGMSWVLVSAGWGVMGALWGAVAAQVAVVLACVPGLPRWDGTTRARPAHGDWRGESFSDTAVMVLFSLFCFMDIFVVKHGLPEEAAAGYSRAALIGKSFLYLATALNMVLLPEVAAARAKGEPTVHLLWRFLAMAALLLGAGLGLIWAWTGLAIRVLCGSDPAFQALVPLTRDFSLAMMPLALFQLVMTYHLAVGTRALPVFMAVVTLAYGLVLAKFGGEVGRVVLSLGAAGSMLLAGSLLLLRRAAARAEVKP